MIKAVIFDLDDTLINEVDYIRSGFLEVARYLNSQLGVDCNELVTMMWMLFKQRRRDVFNRLLREYAYTSNDLVTKCVEVYREHIPDLRMRNGAESLLKDLFDSGYKLGLITDGRPQGQWNKINAIGLKQYVSYIIVTDELGGVMFRKPCDVAYRKMLSAMAIKPESAVYVGDNLYKDFITPNVLGMQSVMLKNYYGVYLHDVGLEINTINKPLYYANDFTSLRSLLIDEMDVLI